MYCLKKLFDTLDGLSEEKLDVKVVQNIMQNYFNVISFMFVWILKVNLFEMFCSMWATIHN